MACAQGPEDPRRYSASTLGPPDQRRLRWLSQARLWQCNRGCPMNAAIPNWLAPRAQAEAESAALLKSDPALAIALPQIEAALVQLLADNPAAEETELLQQLGTTAAARLRSVGVKDWADDFEQRLVRGEGSFAARLVAVELAVGAAAGELFGRNPGDAELTL